MTITRNWDDIGRLESIANTPASAADPMSFTYTYNDLNQRTRRTLEQGDYWAFSYDALGQVTGAEKRQSNDNLLPGYEFAFDFDDIGNRKTATRNGETSTYTVNALNQYSQRTVPGVTEVRGTAAAAATVTVNEQSVQREGEYFFKKLSLDNSTDSVWEEITVKGVIPEGGHDDTDAIAEDTFHRWLPETPEAYSHDADGNLEFDARWDYTWNGEPRPEGRAALDSGQVGRNPKGDRLAGSERSQNRLIAMETRPAAYQAGVPRERLEFVYDSQGRRVLKVHLQWDDTEETFVETRRDRFVYAASSQSRPAQRGNLEGIGPEGGKAWNLLVQVTERPDLDTAYVSQRFVWGIDLSGGMRGAGGVGGLLMVRFSGNITVYPAYDGNGNVMGLFEPAEGEWVAEYEYGAFGEPLRSTGPLAERNRFRFSTKYTDSTTGMLYYGFRYLDPETGRWLNRDPIGERGGLNLYGFLGNNAVSQVDRLGMHPALAFAYQCARSIVKDRLFHWFNQNLKGDQIVKEISYECASDPESGRVQVSNLLSDVGEGPKGWGRAVAECITSNMTQSISRSLRANYRHLDNKAFDKLTSKLHSKAHSYIDSIDSSEPVLETWVSYSRTEDRCAMEFDVEVHVSFGDFSTSQTMASGSFNYYVTPRNVAGNCGLVCCKGSDENQ